MQPSVNKSKESNLILALKDEFCHCLLECFDLVLEACLTLCLLDVGEYLNIHKHKATILESKTEEISLLV